MLYSVHRRNERRPFGSSHFEYHVGGHPATIAETARRLYYEPAASHLRYVALSVRVESADRLSSNNAIYYLTTLRCLTFQLNSNIWRQ